MEKNFSIEIPRFLNKPLQGKDVVYFELIVTRNKETWKLEKRFSECRLLYDDLLKSHGESLPPFPSKSFFALKNYDALNARRQKLEFFFQQILKRQDLIRDKNTQNFLKFELKINEDIIAVTKMLSKLSCSFGVRDFEFDLGNKYLI